MMPFCLVLWIFQNRLALTCLFQLLDLPRVNLYWMLKKNSSLILSLSPAHLGGFSWTWPSLSVSFLPGDCKSKRSKVLDTTSDGSHKEEWTLPKNCCLCCCSCRSRFFWPLHWKDTLLTHVNLLSTKNLQTLLPSCSLPGWPLTCAVARCQSEANLVKSNHEIIKSFWLE